MEGSTMIQYVDDVLICSVSQTALDEDLDILLRHITKVGLKASREKAQIALPGNTPSLSARKLTVGRKDVIQRLSIPATIRGVKKTLGLFDYVRSFISSFSFMAASLNDLTVGEKRGHDPVAWTPECEEAFEKLKQAQCEAPALGISDVNRKFVIFVHEDRGHCTAVITQKHGRKKDVQ